MKTTTHFLLASALGIVASCASCASASPAPSAPSTSSAASVTPSEHKNIQAPRVLQRFEPVYSDELRKKSVHGVVEVAGTVPKEGGSLRNAHIVASDDPRLNQPALAAVSRWIWSPGLQDGQAVDVEFSTKISFSIQHFH